MGRGCGAVTVALVYVISKLCAEPGDCTSSIIRNVNVLVLKIG